MTMLTENKLSENQQYQFDYQVQEADLASALPVSDEDRFPAVLATSRMIAFMELAAARLMAPLLAPGQLSVGVGVNITHLAATLGGETIRVRARFLGIDGKLYRFHVSIEDGGGVAGEGEHTRAVVDTGRLLASAEKRRG